MILYALTILVSAFLLFQVQPVIAKIILPWFGSGLDYVPAVFPDGPVARISVRACAGAVSEAQDAGPGACGAVAGERAAAADLPECVVEAVGGGRPDDADPVTRSEEQT